MSNYIWFVVAIIFAIVISFIAYRKAQYKKDLEAVKKSIACYWKREFDSEVTEDSFKNLSNLGLAYTTDDEYGYYEYQISVNLLKPSIIYSIDGKAIKIERYKNLKQMLKDFGEEGENLGFDALYWECSDYFFDHPDEFPDPNTIMMEGAN